MSLCPSAMITIGKPANTFYLFPGIISLSQKLLWCMLFTNRFEQIFYCSSTGSFICIYGSWGFHSLQGNLWDPEIKAFQLYLKVIYFTTLKWREVTTSPYPENMGLFCHTEWSQPASLCGKGSCGRRESVRYRSDSYHCWKFSWGLPLKLCDLGQATSPICTADSHMKTRQLSQLTWPSNSRLLCPLSQCPCFSWFLFLVFSLVISYS